MMNSLCNVNTQEFPDAFPSCHSEDPSLFKSGDHLKEFLVAYCVAVILAVRAYRAGKLLAGEKVSCLVNALQSTHSLPELRKTDTILD